MTKLLLPSLFLFCCCYHCLFVLFCCGFDSPGAVGQRVFLHRSYGPLGHCTMLTTPTTHTNTLIWYSITLKEEAFAGIFSSKWFSQFILSSAYFPNVWNSREKFPQMFWNWPIFLLSSFWANTSANHFEISCWFRRLWYYTICIFFYWYIEMIIGLMAMIFV